MNSTACSSHSRQSMRLDGFDYSQDGAYFVTLCTEDRASLFSEVVNGDMRLNAAGEAMSQWWKEIPHKYPSVALDAYVIMPNHLHGILLLVGADLRVRPGEKGAHIGAPLQNPSLGDVMKWFKTMTTNAYMRGVKSQNWPTFCGKLWQRNYYDHIIRNLTDADRIRAYIDSNPATWLDDENYPARMD